jgi:ABC-type transport system involved in cytochrome bd biosynthesis fused ATPase/permease subunit
MEKARRLLHEAVLAVVLGIGLVVGLAFIDGALAAVVAIMLVGLLVVIVPIVAILGDERQDRRLTH